MEVRIQAILWTTVFFVEVEFEILKQEQLDVLSSYFKLIWSKM